jgi:hypothetical protein
MTRPSRFTPRKVSLLARLHSLLCGLLRCATMIGHRALFGSNESDAVFYPDREFAVLRLCVLLTEVCAAFSAAAWLVPVSK